MAAERRRRALAMLVSDDELNDLMQNKQKGECKVCFERDFIEPFFMCSKHSICKMCKGHATLSGITSCALCPVPVANYHVECPSCLKKFFSEVISCACSCGHHFLPKLSRIFKRGAHTYTNFLDAKDKEWLKNQFKQFGGCVWCPTCGQGLQRSDACNELYHCGIEKVCACCGQFNFRFEKGMLEHRKESGCASHVHEDPDINNNESEVTRRKLAQTLN